MACGLWSSPREAPAQPAADYPLSEIDRPLALPRLTLEGRGELFLSRIGAGEGRFRRVENHFGLAAGMGFGLIEALELGIGAGYTPSGGFGLGLPVILAPAPDIGDLQLYCLYDLSPLLAPSAGEWLGAAARLMINVPFATDFGLVLDAPLKLRVHELLAVIGGPALGFSAGGLDALLLGLELGMLVQALPELALSTTLGLYGSLGDPSGLALPLSVRGQYSLLDALDIVADFSFVDLGTGPGWWLIQTGVAYRLDLAATGR